MLHLEINAKNGDAYLRMNAFDHKTLGHLEFDTYEVQHGEQNCAEIILICRKCHHNLYVKLNGTAQQFADLINKDCPSCGEEGSENWILGGIGNYEKEYGDKQ